MPLGKRWKQMTEINKCPFWVSENVLILLLLFQAAALLVWERAGLELWCRGRFGPPSFTAKAKVTVTALGPSGRGMGPHWGMSRRLSDGGGEMQWGENKKRGGVFCPSAYKKVTVSQISPPLHRPAPHDLWPLYFWVNAETEWGKGGGRAQGETHPPRVSGDKRGPQPRLAESVRGTNAQATITKQSHQRLHISTASACSQPLHGLAFHD